MDTGKLAAAGYALTALLSFWLAAKEGREKREHPKSARFPGVWILLGLTLAVLSGSELFGWIGRLTQDERGRAYVEGWYAQRRDLQWRLLSRVPAAAIAAFVICLVLVRRAWPRYFLAVGALIYAIGYTFVQALSFHFVDKIMGRTWQGQTFWIWAKLFGIGLAALAALPAMTGKRGPTAPREQTETGEGQWV